MSEPEEQEVFMYPVSNLKEAIAAGLLQFFVENGNTLPTGGGQEWIDFCEDAADQSIGVVMDFLLADVSVNAAVQAQVSALFVDDQQSDQDKLVDVRVQMTRAGIMAATGLSPVIAMLEPERKGGNPPPEDPDDSTHIVKGG